MARDSPRILSVEREPLHVLREAAVAGGSKCASDVGSRAGFRIALRGRRNVIKRQRSRDAAAVGAGRIEIAIGIRGILDELLRRGGEGAAQHRFVNEIDSELEGVITGHMTQVVAELILILVAQVREQSDGSGELVIAEGLEAGNG